MRINGVIKQTQIWPPEHCQKLEKVAGSAAYNQRKTVCIFIPQQHCRAQWAAQWSNETGNLTFYNMGPLIFVLTGYQLSSRVYFPFRKEPPDPNAPLPPLPLHLHPPPLLKRPSLDGKKERSGSDEFSWEAACTHSLGYLKKKKKQPLIWFFSSALNPCVVCHSRKESSDSKPPSLKKTSDHVKKDRSGIWELFCFSFVLEKMLCCCPWRISGLRL